MTRNWRRMTERGVLAPAAGWRVGACERKTDKSFLWSKWRRGMSCGETHWQYEVMRAEAGGRKAEFPAYPIPTLHY